MDDPGLPALDEFFALTRDERGAPCGVHPIEERLDAAAKEADPAVVLAVLESGKDPAEAVVAVFLAARAARKAPRLAPKFEKVLLRLVSDLRALEASIEGVRQVFDLAACAFGAYFELIRLRPPDPVAILAILGSSLVNPRRTDLTAAAVHQFNVLFEGDPRHEAAADQVAELLADAVADGALSPSTRVRAYEAIVCGARFPAGPGRKGAPAGAVFEKHRVRAAEALVQALETGPAKPELREYILCNLDTIQPEAIARLQEKGVILLATLPPPRDLVSFEWRGPDPAKAARASLGLKPEQVLDALQNTDEKDPAVFSGVLAAPFFPRRAPWPPFAEALLQRAASDHRLEVRSGEQAAQFHLGREAALALLGLLRGVRPADEAQAVDWFFKGLDACLERGMTSSWAPVAPVMEFLFELNRREASTGGRLKKAMAALISAPGRPAKPRITAFCTFRNLDREADSWAQAALLNPKEDPEFVGLLRSLIVHR